MRPIFAALTLTASLFAGAATAQKAGTVVELYTSQGCSSCPPADAMLAELAQRADVIALALHVDYWDYIGWADDLAKPAFTARQKAFAAAAGAATVYTPQMVIGGVDHVVGSKPMQVMDQVMRHNGQPDPVQVQVSRNGNTVAIAAAANTAGGDAVVQVVRYTPMVTRDIRRGENAGRTIKYANVVTDWQVAGTWQMSQPLRMQAAVPGADRIVVIVQRGTNGPILGAVELN